MPFAFVDIETTGSHLRYDRIIEIGILRVEEGTLVRTYKQLINPETYLSPFIEQITGITPILKINLLLNKSKKIWRYSMALPSLHITSV
jgi:DNA polymerase III alpha subunit (gram-positive type)